MVLAAAATKRRKIRGTNQALRDFTTPKQKTKRPAKQASSSGRYWARNGPTVDSLSAIWGDFEPLLQGLLVDAEGRPISLSATGFYSAVGRIRDVLASSDIVRRAAEVVLDELTGRLHARGRDEADA